MPSDPVAGLPQKQTVMSRGCERRASSGSKMYTSRGGEVHDSAPIFDNWQLNDFGWQHAVQ